MKLRHHHLQVRLNKLHHSTYRISHNRKMAPSRTKKWSTELKAGFCKCILNKQIDPDCTDTAYIEKIRQRYYSDRPYETFRKNWNTSIAEYRVGKAQDLYNKGELDDKMTARLTNSYD